MIKIEHVNLDKISRNYFNQIKVSIKSRCDYFLNVLNVIFRGASNNLKQHSLHGSLKKTLTNQLLLATSKLENQSQYVNVLRANIEPWVVLQEQLIFDILNYLKDDKNLEDLILCRPDSAINTENDVKNSVGLTTLMDSNIKLLINSIIDFSLFDDYAYKIANELNVNTCPYCNRNYINTVISKKGKGIIRPTFDHFFSQKHHPFLALSFFNLIPSCYYCNSSLKGSNVMKLDTHLHPYLEGFYSDVTFNVLIKDLKPNKSDPENFSLIFKDNMIYMSPFDRYRKIFGGSRVLDNLKEGNINLFKLKDIYQSHLDIVGELVVKCDMLNTTYANSLKSILEPLASSNEEFYQFYFGNYFNEKNFNRRPMAKLTKDLVEQILPVFNLMSK